jgi:hypothetical protein
MKELPSDSLSYKSFTSKSRHRPHRVIGFCISAFVRGFVLNIESM